jgi:hypothetical protein
MLVLPLSIAAPLSLQREFGDTLYEKNIVTEGNSDTKPTDISQEFVQDEGKGKLDLNQIRLRRLRKAEVPFAPSTSPSPTPPLNIPAPTFVFDGKLIGTIIDDDPAFSFAIIQLPNATIRLVRRSMPVDDQNPEITVHELHLDRAILMCQGTQQTLDLQPEK